MREQRRRHYGCDFCGDCEGRGDGGGDGHEDTIDLPVNEFPQHNAKAVNITFLGEF